MNVGQGLNSICNAVAEELDTIGVENCVFNVFENAKHIEKTNSVTYYKVAKVFPLILRRVQIRLASYDRKLSNKTKPVFIQKELDALEDVLEKKIVEGGYDVVFTPVSSVAIYVSKLKEMGKLDCKLIYCIPDFNLPAYMELCKNADVIVTNCNENHNRLLRNHLDEKKLAKLGLPIDKRFFEKLDKSAVRQKLGFEKEDFVVLISSGGAGFGKMSKMIKVLAVGLPDVKFIVVNGKNQKEKDNIDALISKNDLKNVKNFGFCLNMNELMDASDVMIAKTGAATLCECYAKKLPLISLKQSLYPECDNMKHLLKYNAMIGCESIKDCKKVLQGISEKSINLNEVLDNYQGLFDKNSAKNIVNKMFEVC